MANDTPGATVVTDPAKTVVQTGSAGHGDYGGRAYGPAWSAEPTFGQTAQAVHVANGDMHLLNTIFTQFGFLAKEVAQEGGASREAVRDEGRFVGREVSDSRREIASGFGHTDEELAEGFGDVKAKLAYGFGETRETIRVEACKTREVVKDQVAAVQLLAVQNAAAAALAAATNTAAIQKSLSDCCCEVKELIRGEAQATRELIAANEAADLRSKLSVANSALLALKAQVIL